MSNENERMNYAIPAFALSQLISLSDYNISYPVSDFQYFCKSYNQQFIDFGNNLLTLKIPDKGKKYVNTVEAALNEYVDLYITLENHGSIYSFNTYVNLYYKKFKNQYYFTAVVSSCNGEMVIGNCTLILSREDLIINYKNIYWQEHDSDIISDNKSTIPFEQEGIEVLQTGFFVGNVINNYSDGNLYVRFKIEEDI